MGVMEKKPSFRCVIIELPTKKQQLHALNLLVLLLPEANRDTLKVCGHAQSGVIPLFLVFSCMEFNFSFFPSSTGTSGVFPACD